MKTKYKKNTKDKNRKGKERIRKEIEKFDEMLVFQTKEELASLIETFLYTVPKDLERKYISSYIRYTLQKREKFIKQWERKKSCSLKKEMYQKRIERERKVLAYLNERLEGQKKKRSIKSKKENAEKETTETSSTEEQMPSFVYYDFLHQLQEGNFVACSVSHFSEYKNAFCFYLQENILDDTYIQNIHRFIDFLYLLEKEKKITKEEVESNLYAIIDILKYKIKKTDKCNQQMREKYKRVKSQSEIVLEIYKEDRYKPKHDYYYDILEVLLQSCHNYYVIEKLLLTMKEFVNAKKWVHTRDTRYTQHILYTIVDLYIRSYKLELRNQTKDFVPREYYRKLYYLFLENPYLDIDKEGIHQLLQDFVSSTEQAQYLKNNKDRIMEEVDAMLTGKEVTSPISISDNAKEYVQNISYAMTDIISHRRDRMDAQYLAKMRSYYDQISSQWENPTKEQIKQIKQTLGICNRVKRDMLLGLTTIAFCDDYSYSIGYYEDGSYSFRLHMLDLHATIQDTPLEEYLYKALYKNGSSALRVDALKMKEGKVIPSITYETRIAHNGSVGPLKIYISTSEVEKRYDSTLEMGDSKLSPFIALYKMLTDDHKPNLDSEIVNQYFFSFFSTKIMQYAEERGLPLIVKGVSEFDKEHYMQLHYSLCEIYSKIKREHFEKVFEILSTHLEKEHFVNHDYEHGKYFLPFENDYVKYWNQQVLKEHILQKEEDRMVQNSSAESSIESMIMQSNEIMEKANAQISYVGMVKPIDKRRKKVYHKC